jgi:segregation and condensation protein B
MQNHRHTEAQQASAQDTESNMDIRPDHENASPPDPVSDAAVSTTEINAGSEYHPNSAASHDNAGTDDADSESSKANDETSDVNETTKRHEAAGDVTTDDNDREYHSGGADEQYEETDVDAPEYVEEITEEPPADQDITEAEHDQQPTTPSAAKRRKRTKNTKDDESDTTLEDTDDVEEQDIDMEFLGILEALIFASDEALAFRQIKELLAPEQAGEEEDEATPTSSRRKRPRLTITRVKRAIDLLNAGYEESGRVFRIIEVSGGFAFQTTSEYGAWVGRLFAERARRRLTQSALETLAIVAFKQPISKPAIEAIRGVNAEHVIKSLLERNLISIVGREDSPGRPLLYGSTKTFLKHFGLSSVNDLPKPREIEDLLATDDELAVNPIEELDPGQAATLTKMSSQELERLFDTARLRGEGKQDEDDETAVDEDEPAGASMHVTLDTDSAQSDVAEDDMQLIPPALLEYEQDLAVWSDGDDTVSTPDDSHSPAETGAPDTDKAADDDERTGENAPENHSAFEADDDDETEDEAPTDDDDNEQSDDDADENDEDFESIDDDVTWLADDDDDEQSDHDADENDEDFEADDDDETEDEAPTDDDDDEQSDDDADEIDEDFEDTDDDETEDEAPTDDDDDEQSDDDADEIDEDFEDTGDDETEDEAPTDDDDNEQSEDDADEIDEDFEDTGDDETEDEAPTDDDDDEQSDHDADEIDEDFEDTGDDETEDEAPTDDDDDEQSDDDADEIDEDFESIDDDVTWLADDDDDEQSDHDADEIDEDFEDTGDDETEDLWLTPDDDDDEQINKATEDSDDDSLKNESAAEGEEELNPFDSEFPDEEDEEEIR